MAESRQTVRSVLHRMQITTCDPVRDLHALIAALRPGRRESPGAARRRFIDFCETIDADVAARGAVQARVRSLLLDCRQVGFYADAGILPNSGFFSELFSRIGERIIPPLVDRTELRDCINLIFDRRDDHLWLSELDDETRFRFWRALGVGSGSDPQLKSRTASQMVDAAEILATRIGAMGCEPALARVRPEIREYDSPFLALASELHRFAAGFRAGIEDGAPSGDSRHVLVLIDQCREVGERARRTASKLGTDLDLTYLLKRLDESLRRLNHLVRLTHLRPSAHEADDIIELWSDLLGDGIRGENQRQGIRLHVRRLTELLALRVTENAGRTGEHYISADRSAYFEMWRSAMGAGLIIGGMALLKILASGLPLAPIGYAFFYSLNYSLGFILIHVLGFTIATKQPAMTAATIANTISATRGRVRELKRLAELSAEVVRSQIAAILGNVLVAFPTALAIGWALNLIRKQPFIGSEKAHHLLTDLSPIDSLLILHAAIAGVFLFLTGLISGYFDNLAAYERIGERVERAEWLRRLLGEDRARRVAGYVKDNLGGLAGNAFFGVMLGSTGTIGLILGLPLDIRHVAFAAANLAYALTALRFDIDTATLAWALCGVGLIGAINLAVSFTLALWVALKSRSAPPGLLRKLLRELVAAARRAPRQFFLPPPRSTPGAQAAPDRSG